MLSIFNSHPSKLFKELICDYELDRLNITMHRNELVSGFKKINKCNCLEEAGVSSFIFLKHGQIFKFEKSEFNEIFKFFKKVEVDEIIEMTIIETKPLPKRKNKLIKIKE